MLARVLSSALVLLAAAGCQSDEPAALSEGLTQSPTVIEAPAFDRRSEPAAAVLSLVPASATAVTVTDFDQIRVQLGVPDLTSEDPITDRFDFWERAAREAPLLAEGMLRADSSELLLDYGFGQDDVDWETHFTGPDGNGFVLAFRTDLDLAPVVRAVEAGVGGLAGAQVLPESHIVVSGTADAEEPVWASDPMWARLVGQPSEATYLRRGCLPLSEALGPSAGYDEQQAVLARHPVTNLDDLTGFALEFGDHNATVRMDRNRHDLFDRIDLGRDWPIAAFPATFRNGVGDPATGRIGYAVPEPARAAALALLDELPFAVCNEVTPMAEPTGL